MSFCYSKSNLNVTAISQKYGLTHLGNQSHLYLYGHQTDHTCIYMGTKPITPVSIWAPNQSHLYLYGHQTNHTCIYMGTKPITPVSIWAPNQSHLYLYGHQTNHTCIYMGTKPITPVSIWAPNQSHLYLYGHRNINSADNRKILLSPIEYIKEIRRFST